MSHPDRPAPSPRRWRRTLILLLPLLICFGHWSGGLRLPLVGTLDHVLDDARQLASLTDTPETRIIVVDIDEKSLAELGRWPWSRDRLARLTDEMFDRQGAAVVGFDMVFSEADPSEGLHLMRALAGGPMRGDNRFAQTLEQLRPTLDHDAAFAHALSGRRAVLGFYLTSDNAGPRTGRLPSPLFDADDHADEPPGGNTAAPGKPAASGLLRWQGFGSNLPTLAQAAGRAGFFNVLPDEDGVVRSVPLLAEWAPASGPRQVHQSFALAVLRAVLGDPLAQGVRPPGLGGSLGLSALRLAEAPASGTAPGAADAAAQPAKRKSARQLDHVDFALDEHGAVRVPFRRAEQFQFMSATDLIHGRIPPGSLQGKVVLVGATALGLADLRPTPVGAATPGVVVHASLLAGLLDGNLPLRPDWARGFEAFALIVACVFLAVLLPRLGGTVAMGVSLLTALAWLAVNALLYRVHGWVLPMALPLAGAVGTAALALGLGYAAEGRSRRALAQLFGAYVPPELVKRMEQDPDHYTRAGLSADNRELTVLFCDLRDFTRTAEHLAPEQLREVVNLFFSRMTAVVARHEGTLDKYIGDAVMAFWGAPVALPDHAARAVRAAVEMTSELEDLNADLQSRGLPQVLMGVGINTGWVCVGDLGSDTRRSYTVIGDAVNLAARIETLTRQYHRPILVGETTWKAARAATDDLPWQIVGEVAIRGRDEKITICTPSADPSMTLAGTGKRESAPVESDNTPNRAPGL